MPTIEDWLLANPVFWAELNSQMAAVDAPAEKPKQADYHGPGNIYDPSYPAHKAVHDATEHLLNDRVTNSKARRGLRDALDQADKAPTGPLPDGSHRAPDSKAFKLSGMNPSAWKPTL